AKAMDFVKVLLAAGINPNATNTRYPDTPITSAVSAGHREVVALLLAQPGIKVDAQDQEGDTALMLAARHGSLDIVDLLLKAGANPNLATGIIPDAANTRFGCTALMSAARYGYLDIVQLLLKAGANPNLKNNRGETAADLAQ